MLVELLTERFHLSKPVAVEWRAGEFQTQQCHGSIKGRQSLGKIHRKALSHESLVPVWLTPAGQK